MSFFSSFIVVTFVGIVGEIIIFFFRERGRERKGGKSASSVPFFPLTPATGSFAAQLEELKGSGVSSQGEILKLLRQLRFLEAACPAAAPAAVEALILGILFEPHAHRAR